MWARLIVLLALAGGCQRSEPGWRPLLERLDVRDERVLEAMARVSRADFLPVEERRHAQEDRPLGIGFGQTTSQPSLIAYMLAQLALRPGCRVLEVGTGCGYQTALLAELCRDVYSLDIVEPLARSAARTLAQKGYANAHVKAGDGYAGWPDAAPFDGIVVAAGAVKVPPALVSQLEPGGRLIIPLGEGDDMRLLLLTRKEEDGGARAFEQTLIPVRFVPLTGDAAERDRRE
jgi:protein-L-isoaspartate(D-aspartate) O-methyltransferase